MVPIWPTLFYKCRVFLSVATNLPHRFIDHFWKLLDVLSEKDMMKVVVRLPRRFPASHYSVKAENVKKQNKSPTTNMSYLQNLGLHLRNFVVQNNEKRMQEANYGINFKFFGQAN